MLSKIFGCVRFVYNYYLDKRIKVYETEKRMLTYAECAHDMSVLKHNMSFLKEADSISLQQSLRHLDNAFVNFFRKPETGFPRFKSKKRNKRSYTTVKIKNNIVIANGCIRLPKIGYVKMKQHRAIPDNYTLKSVTVSQATSGKYHVSILFEYENQVPQRCLQTFLGLDFSMKELYKDSNGNEPCYPKYYRQAEKRLKREQRKLSLMQKGSKNREKQRLKIAVLHERIAN